MSDKKGKPIYQKPTARSLGAPAAWGDGIPLLICTTGPAPAGGNPNQCSAGPTTLECFAGANPQNKCAFGSTPKH